MRKSRLLGIATMTALAMLLAACTTHYAYRTKFVDPGLANGGVKTCELAGMTDEQIEASTDAQSCAHVTPEITQAYELHFVEFDDQGWLYPDKDAQGNRVGGATVAAEQPSKQIDQLMTRLRTLVESGEDLSIILFVHGWKHSAKLDDGNLIEFRALLRGVSVDEQYKSKSGRKPRHVVGIYVGWRGLPWSVPDPLLNLSFWSRKDAARRVSTGSARELFARLRSLQRFANQPATQRAAAGQPLSEQANRPQIRTLMIGHSFGGLILYSATFGSLIEVLSAQQDLPRTPGSNDPAQQATARTGYDPAERIADMIVLVNPAFEASRYEPLLRVARNYHANAYQPPLLVTVTSVGDWATGLAFPAGRFVNTIFEHPVSSPEEAEAIKTTPGHMTPYFTHQLWASPEEAAQAMQGKRTFKAIGTACAPWKTLKLPDKADPALIETLSVNKRCEVDNAMTFFRSSFEHTGGPLKPGWVRHFCGGPYLVPIVPAQPAGGDPDINMNTPVWNVTASKSVIYDHNDVMNPVFVNFIRQLYADVSLDTEDIAPAP